MKKIVFLIPLFLMMSACQKSDERANLQVEEFIRNQNFFKLSTYIDNTKTRISKKNYVLAEAFLNNTFNKNEVSNAHIDVFMEKYSKGEPDTLITELLWLRADNYLKLFEYKKAYEANKIILNKYPTVLDSTELAETHTMGKIYETLANTPRQTIKIEDDQVIPITRDVVGLMNIGVTLNDSSYSFIFDTGAGMSVITRSFAEKLNLKIADVNIDVGAATGNTVQSSLAVIDKLQIAGIEVNNAVFLVMEDELIQFPQLNFFPLGIIGFPVIEEFREITLTKTDTLFIPQTPHNANLKNLRLSSLVPHVYLYNGQDTLEYAFDTGAKSSHMTQKYFNLYEKELFQGAKIDTIISASAGGQKEVTAILQENIPIFIGNKRAELNNIHVHNSFNKTFKDVYGNLGQDLIGQFDKMTLNFESMFLKFE